MADDFFNFDIGNGLEFQIARYWRKFLDNDRIEFPEYFIIFLSLGSLKFFDSFLRISSHDLFCKINFEFCCNIWQLKIFLVKFLKYDEL